MLSYFTNVGYSKILKGKSCHFKQFQNINELFSKKKNWHCCLLDYHECKKVKEIIISHNTKKAVQRIVAEILC